MYRALLTLLPLLDTSMLASSYQTHQNGCKDLYRECRYVKSYCDNYHVKRPLERICPQTCDACNNGCKDLYHECRYVKSYCDKYHFKRPLEKICPQTCDACNNVPCDPRGGQIKQQQCCPFMGNYDLSQCTYYDACVCRDGFIGDQCEHDCEKEDCPERQAQVCAGDAEIGVDITYYNKCFFYKAQCFIQRLVLKYDGACQDDAICGPINCPMETSVQYYDDPDRPGCKLCRADPNAPC